MDVKNAIIKYLEGQKEIADEALKAYEPGSISDSDEKIRRMREVEAIKLRTTSTDLKKHIAVINAMFPDAK